MIGQFCVDTYNGFDHVYSLTNSDSSEDNTVMFMENGIAEAENMINEKNEKNDINLNFIDNNFIATF